MRPPWISGAPPGIPEFPRAWIIQTARHKAIDRIRRRALLEEKLESYAASGLTPSVEEPDYDTNEIPDDRLRLIFTCCHPALALEAQVALTLRTLGGLETEEIARAFLVPARHHGAAPGASKAQDSRCAGFPTPCPAPTTCPSGSTPC